MEFFIKEIFEKGESEKSRQYFTRYGKGNYKRRFLIKLTKGKKIKIRTSFELANVLVEFVRENNADSKFSGKVLTKNKIEGVVGRKKGSGYLYEITDDSLEKFDGAYCYLLDSVDDENLVLKIKKSLPKPGKKAEKIDDKFCSLDLDEKYWEKAKETFFWDIPENVKRISAEHELAINEIVFPEGESDPVKIRELAKRKGKIIRTVIADGNETISEHDFVI